MNRGTGYQLLIVEDEAAIAHGIANSLPWEEWGFAIAGICANGLEAVRQIQKEKPDVVLSDIRMPEMDGVELMEYLHRTFPEIKVLILSGFNDFAYLQTAIRNQVVEYLLKPTDVDEFEATFRRMKALLDQEARERQALEAMEQTAQEGKALQKQRYYNALIQGYGYDEAEAEQEFYQERAELLGIVFFVLDHGRDPDAGQHYANLVCVTETLNQITANREIQGVFFLNYEERMTGLLRMEADVTQEEIRSYLRGLIRGVEAETGIPVSAGVSGSYADFKMLPQCYEQAKCCASQRIFTEEKQYIMFYQEIEESEFNYREKTFAAESLVKHILNQEEEALRAEVAETFAAFKNRRIKDYDYINRLGLEALFNVSRSLLKYQLRPEEVMIENGHRYTDIYQKQKIESKQEFLCEIFLLFAEALRKQAAGRTKTGDLAQQIRKIVDQEYCSNRISLEYVAEKVHKNTAYISKIFKNEFQCNFSTYITEKRLERSRILLEDLSLKIYEISRQLGWADVSNYIKVFKKKYGISPEEYRRLAGQTPQHGERQSDGQITGQSAGQSTGQPAGYAGEPAGQMPGQVPGERMGQMETARGGENG